MITNIYHIYIYYMVFVEHVVLTPRAALMRGCRDSPPFGQH